MSHSFAGLSTSGRHPFASLRNSSSPGGEEPRPSSQRCSGGTFCDGRLHAEWAEVALPAALAALRDEHSPPP